MIPAKRSIRTGGDTRRVSFEPRYALRIPLAAKTLPVFHETEPRR